MDETRQFEGTNLSELTFFDPSPKTVRHKRGVFIGEGIRFHTILSGHEKLSLGACQLVKEN